MATAEEQRKLAERVQKLLRLAAPNSNNSEHERAVAAQEAVRLIAEHGLLVTPEPPKKKKRREPTPQPAYVYQPAPRSASEWADAYAPEATVCVDPDCGGSIEEGEPVWLRMKGGVILECLHVDCPTGTQRVRRGQESW